MKLTVEHGEFQHDIDFPLNQFTGYQSHLARVTTSISFLIAVLIASAGSDSSFAILLAVVFVSIFHIGSGLISYLLVRRKWIDIPMRYEGDAVETRIIYGFKGDYNPDDSVRNKTPLSPEVMMKINKYLRDFQIGSGKHMFPVEYMLTLEQAESIYGYPHTPESKLAFGKLPEATRYAIRSRIEWGKGFTRGLRDALRDTPREDSA